MKKIFLLSLLTAILFTIGCETKTEVKKDDHSEHTNQSNTSKPKGSFTAEIKTNPAEVKAGEQTELSFTIKNSKGEIVKDLEIVHEKLIHLLMVSEDLAEFYHEHPEQQADGTFKVTFTFKNGGKFKVYADFKPKDGEQTVQSFDLTVSGNPRRPLVLEADSKFEKTVDDLFVTMKPNGDLNSGRDLMIDFNVFDAKTKKPVTDLQNYLGEKAHFVIISQDLKEFVHAHPMSHGSDHSHSEKAESKTEPTVSAHINFPKTSLYKIFVQFQRNGKIITVPFVVDVKGGEAKAENTKPVEIPADALKVTVSKDGFEPSEINFAAGKYKKLAFSRIDNENCADEIVFKSLDIKKKLPVGEVVLVDLPDTLKGNTIEFACGMNMYKGKIVIE